MPAPGFDQDLGVSQDARCVVGELVERSPARQLAVQAGDHIHRGRMMIAGESVGHSASEGLCFLLGYRRDHGHASARSPLADNAVPEEDEAIVDVGDMGPVHIQRQFQAVLQKGPAFLADGLGMCLGALDDDRKVVGITAVGNSGFPLPVLANRHGTPLLDAEVPRPAILAGLVVQVFRFQPGIELMEHDIGQERRQHAALRNTFARRDE